MKIVLYQPQQSDKTKVGQSTLDLIPTEMMSIATFPRQDGHEVVIIDGSLYDQAEAHRRVVEACADAKVFGITGILGYMVTDGYLAAAEVKQKHPDVVTIAGGWFASVMPHLFLRDGVIDAVCDGQGELTFREFCQAVDAGTSLEEVAGLVLWRDGDIHKTDHRAVVGWDQLADPSWDLIDITPYREGQLAPDAPNHAIRMAGPPSTGKRAPYFGISYFSSFGCPEPCTFCCSPEVTNRRWKAKPAERIVDDLQMLQERWGHFHAVRFLDANFGVMEKRTRKFAELCLERELNFHWNAFIETYSVNNYKESTLDLCAESGYYVAEVGAETGDPETMKRIGKPIKDDDNFNAAVKLHDRNIWSSVTYIIGFPNEPASSMRATIDQARRVQLACPNSSTHVLPFRPIPGTAMYQESLELGYSPPDDIHFWGHIGEYHTEQTWNVIPDDVMKERFLHNHYTTLYKGIARKRRGLFERIAKWRLEKNNLSFPIDAKLFGVVNRIENKLFPERRVKKDIVDQALG